MHRRELPREAFLGEMVVGHKNTKLINSLSHERIVRTFAKIADKLGEKGCVKVIYKIYKTFAKFAEIFVYLKHK